MTKEIILIAHNIRSTHNIGSILRTCDGFGVSKVHFTGYTPYPKTKNDNRLPHIAEKLHKQIHKTALGAEESVSWHKKEDIKEVLQELLSEGFELIALEQSIDSIPLNLYSSTNKIAVLIGEEINGVNEELIKLCNKVVEIPMFGTKESFNVSVAVGIVLYRLKFS